MIHRKLQALEHEVIDPVRLEHAVNISTPPAHPRVSFPAQFHTPAFEILDRPALGRLVASELASVPTPLSELLDVSSSPAGVCMVTCNIVARWNSHAGSHADQPRHWLPDPPFPEFDDRQYRGSATILDLTRILEDQRDSRITAALLQQAAQAAEVDLNGVRRLLLRTYRTPPAQWESHYPYLDAGSGEFLGSLPELVLLGIDTPSVDHPAAAPIGAQAHGGLWAGRVAILEGLDLSALRCLPRLDGVLQTLWNPMQVAPDAKGALVLFFPTI